MAADISRLIADLSSSDMVSKSRAAESLAKMGEGARPAAVPLVRSADCMHETVREWVISALESLGPPHEDDLPALRELVGSENEESAYWAITLLGRLEAKALPAVPALVEALKRSSAPFIPQKAAWALGSIGPAAKAALPALEQAAQSADPRLARLARNFAIKQITQQ
jgi:HEAT repeat protein